ncbi:glutamate receptor ionotropic, kainate 2-like [Oratosquilla oratoria]|uniref:glutamate receptor ionotropic, kainate 2-like n=1 Tax=Oratosquilla oratoria TaxID=337810 RepID=UPI003F75DD76
MTSADKIEERLPPYTYLEGGQWKGILFNILRELARKESFCYNIIRSPDNKWGIRFPNGSWSGMMGQLRRREVALAVGPFALSEQRSQAASFSEPMFIAEQRVFYKRPDFEPDLAAFVKPYTYDVWLYIALASVFIIFCVWLVRTVSDGGNSTGVVTLFSNSFKWGFAVLLAQSERMSPTGLSGRLVGSLWILVSFIFITVYKSNLKAMLISPKVHIPFDSFEELVAQDEWKWKVVEGTALHQALRDASPDTFYGRAWRKNSGFYTTNIVSVNHEMARGDYAALLDSVLITVYMGVDFKQYGRCRLTVTRNGFMKLFMLTMGFQKDSPLLGAANRM